MSETILFFGSGPVAAESLRLLIKHTPVEAVVTKPRAEHYRGSVPVLELAAQLGLRVFTPRTKQELSELFTTKPVTSTLGIVIDYGIVIAEDVIDYFPLGIINSHFSLLPEWRGADPITFAILSGQGKTGVSLMLIDEGLDTGKIISMGEQPLDATVTTPELTQQLVYLSDALLRHEIPRHFSQQTKAISQEEAARLIGRSSEPTYSRKLTKEDGTIDWSKTAIQIEREIRAFIDWPKSRTTLGNIDVVITSAEVTSEQIQPRGTVTVRGKELLVGCAEGSLRIIGLKPAGKKEMTAQAFLAGYKKFL
jgi:methionyl-tRNA formyltransferase